MQGKEETCNIPELHESVCLVVMTHTQWLNDTAQGMECTRQMATMEDDTRRNAVSATYFGSLPDAHDAYITAGRTDLALQAHAQHGNWSQVIAHPTDTFFFR